MKKQAISAIIITFLGLVGVLSVFFRMYFISHVSIFMMGMIVGSIVNRNTDRLEKWSRKSLKEHGL